MEDFNQPSPERTALLEQLEEKFGSVPPYLWALCQVCDLQTLENLIGITRICPIASRDLAVDAAKTTILYWTQSSTPDISQIEQDSGSSPASSPPTKRQETASSPLLKPSEAVTALARDRDRRHCVLTGEWLVQPAHIFPSCRLSGSEEEIFGARYVFWYYLRNVWSKEKGAACEAVLFPNGLSERGEERVDNMITLSLQAHEYWKRGAFALKPISLSDDNTVLKVQFFWQKKQPDLQATMNLCTTPLSTEGLVCNEGASGFDGDVTRLIKQDITLLKSGDIFDLKTDDPIKKPLPKFALLELQWALNRVVGMVGPASPYEPTDSDDNWEVVGEDEYDDDGGNDCKDDPDVAALALDETSLISDP